MIRSGTRLLAIFSTALLFGPGAASAQPEGRPFRDLQEQVDALSTQNEGQQELLEEEAAARQAGDAALQELIEAEEEARAAGDEALQDGLDDLGEEVEALGGDTFVVESAPVAVPAGALQVIARADCPADSVVTGGGYSFAQFIDMPFDASLIWVKQSRPDGAASWFVEVWNLDASNAQPPFTVQAVCLPR